MKLRAKKTISAIIAGALALILIFFASWLFGGCAKHFYYVGDLPQNCADKAIYIGRLVERDYPYLDVEIWSGWTKGHHRHAEVMVIMSSVPVAWDGKSTLATVDIKETVSESIERKHEYLNQLSQLTER